MTSNKNKEQTGQMTRFQMRRSFGGDEYVALYNEHHESIKESAASVLNRDRDDAFERFSAMRFPTSHNEEYKYSDFKKPLDIDYGLSLQRQPFPINPYEAFDCDVPGITDSVYYIVNELFYPVSNGNVPALPEGVIVCSMQEASEKYPDLVEKHFGKLVNKQKDNFMAFNGAFALDGFFIYVPKNVQLEKPIQIINVLSSEKDYMVNSRNLVVVEQGAKAQVLICDHTMSDVRFFSNRLTEVFVGENAFYEHYKLESVGEQATDVSSLLIAQEASSNVLSNNLTLHNGVTRNNIDVELNGENAEAILCGMTLSDKEQLLDNHTSVNHNVPNCQSTSLFKYVLDEKSRGGFTGRIFVEKDAQKTLAYQTNNNIVIGPKAKMRTKPQLEIYADDVRCSHGATIGQLDEQALFYMRQRGLSFEEARMMLMNAFTAEVLDNIRIEVLQDRIKKMVERRLRGKLTGKESCMMCN